MNFKALITSVLLASTTVAGVASASPFVRDHRSEPTIRYTAPVRVQSRPSWMINASLNANVNYGFQVDRDGDEVQPYRYGQDPWVEGIRRNQWALLKPCIELQGTNRAVRVDLNGKSLSSVEFQSTAGDMNVSGIGVVFSDGTQLPIKVYRALDSHEPNMRFDLGAHGRVGIEAIVVEGSGYGSFRVIGA